MAKLTKRDRDALREVLRELERAEKYILNECTVVCNAGKHASTLHHFTRELDDTVLYPVNKRVGSDLVGLYRAGEKLAHFIVHH